MSRGAGRLGPAARFDTAALQPFDPALAGACHWPALRQWCMADLGSGATPLLRPWALPQVRRRLACASYSGADGATALAQAAALALDLDGTRQLSACTGSGARLGLRLRVKLQDQMWWRARRPDDVWDSGWVSAEPAAWRALARFVPRRATFIVLPPLPAEMVMNSLRALAARSAGFAQPVRVLVLGALPGREAGPVTLLAPPRAYMPA